MIWQRSSWERPHDETVPGNITATGRQRRRPAPELFGMAGLNQNDEHFYGGRVARSMPHRNTASAYRDRLVVSLSDLRP